MWSPRLRRSCERLTDRAAKVANLPQTGGAVPVPPLCAKVTPASFREIKRYPVQTGTHDSFLPCFMSHVPQTTAATRRIGSTPCPQESAPARKADRSVMLTPASRGSRAGCPRGGQEARSEASFPAGYHSGLHDLFLYRKRPRQTRRGLWKTGSHTPAPVGCREAISSFPCRPSCPQISTASCRAAWHRFLRSGVRHWRDATLSALAGQRRFQA